MNQTLTLAEIQARYDAEWVLIGDPQFGPDSQLIRGTVLFHSKSRDELDARDAQLRPPAAAIIYTGEIPDDVAVVL